MRYAIIEHNKVVNVAISESPMADNWIQSDTASVGDDFVEGAIVPQPQPEPTPPVADPCEWLIDIGPFFDRFGAQKIAILANPDATVQAIVKDVMSRKWIDLQRADVGQAIDIIIAKGHAVNKSAILTTPVANVENLALRRLYFA